MKVIAANSPNTFTINLILLQSCLMSNKVTLFYSGFTVISYNLRHEDLSVLSSFAILMLFSVGICSG